MQRRQPIDLMSAILRTSLFLGDRDSIWPFQLQFWKLSLTFLSLIGYEHLRRIAP
jgi:hypothetical protein